MNSLKLIVLVCFFNLGFIAVNAQHMAAFEDAQKRFYIFDTNHFYRAEHMPVKQYWVGKIM